MKYNDEPEGMATREYAGIQNPVPVSLRNQHLLESPAGWSTGKPGMEPSPFRGSEMSWQDESVGEWNWSESLWEDRLKDLLCSEIF